MAENKVCITQWQGVWGEKIRMPNGHEYECSKDGQMAVCSDCAAELCSTSGWRLQAKPETKKGVPPVRTAVPGKSDVLVQKKDDVKPMGKEVSHVD